MLLYDIRWASRHHPQFGWFFFSFKIFKFTLKLWILDSPHKGPIMWKSFPCHDINMNFLTPWVFKSFTSQLPSQFCPNLSTIRFLGSVLPWKQSVDINHPIGTCHSYRYENVQLVWKCFIYWYFHAQFTDCQWYDLYLKPQMADETGHNHSFQWHFTVYEGEASVHSKQYVTKMFKNENVFPCISDTMMSNLLPSMKDLGNLV